MSAQRARSAVAAEHRSIHPNIPGVPWWAAVLIAVSATAVGFAVDAGSGNKELTYVFAALYALGCLAAVLVVQRSGIFTAVIQPPLILFAAVPGAYWLFHGARFSGVKNLLINCGYPLIERFPLMLFTSAGVLLVGVVRWYLGAATRPAAKAETGTTATSGRSGPMAVIAAKLTSIWRHDSARAGARGQRHTADRPARTAKPTGGGRPAKRPAPGRSRHDRPPIDSRPEPAVEHPRHGRPTHFRDVEAGPEPPPRRRPRPPHDRGLRGQPPREARRAPQPRQGRPAARDNRFDPYQPMEPYQPPPPRRRPAPNGTDGTDATHHPITRVRYRRSAPS